MKKRWPEAVLVLCGLAALGVLIFRPFRVRIPVEPSCLGKPLRYWVHRLDQPNAEQAQAAIREIGAEAVPLLLRQLRQDELTSAGAVTALSLTGPAALPALSTALEDPDPEIRLAVARAIASLSAQPGADSRVAVPGLIKLASDPESGIRFAAIMALGRFGSNSITAVPVLLGALGDTDRDQDGQPVYVREKAAEALGKIGPPAQMAIPQLSALLNHASCYTRQQAAIALWRITRETNRVLPVLSAMLSGTNTKTRQLAATALQQISLETNLNPRLLAQLEALKPPVLTNRMRRFVPFNLNELQAK